MTATRISVFSVSVLCSLLSLISSQSQARVFAPGPIKIMQYNVENLFDTEHDEGKRDYQFLPKNHPEKKNCITSSEEEEERKENSCSKLDWTAAKLALKLRQIKKVIAAQGSLPDILVLEEVENDNVVNALADVLGFESYTMTDSPDARGIDVAILFNEDRVAYLDESERRVDIGFATRDLLNVNFETPNGEILGVYANHWPAQTKSKSGGTVRVKVANELRLFVESQERRFNTYNVILTGDFNTLKDENPNPFTEVIYNKNWDMGFANVRQLYQKKGGRSYPGGTYFYDKKVVWNEYDIFFASSNLNDGVGLEVVPESYTVNMPLFATTLFEPRKGGGFDRSYDEVAIRVPKSYEHKATTESEAGYSDHFAIVVKLETGL
jgi:hypothetical protein